MTALEQIHLSITYHRLVLDIEKVASVKFTPEQRREIVMLVSKVMGERKLRLVENTVTRTK